MASTKASYGKESQCDWTGMSQEGGIHDIGGRKSILGTKRDEEVFIEHITMHKPNFD